MKGGRIFKTFLDPQGGRLVSVTLGSEGKREAVIDEATFLELMDMGLSPAWSVNREGSVMTFSQKASGSRVTVARVIMDAKPGQQVRFRDGDSRNLRKSNLQLVPGWSTREDRTLI